MLALQLALNALALGAAYALVATGFVLVLNATRAVNFAQGDLVMAGGLMTVALAALTSPDLPAIVLLPGVLAGTAVLGLALSWLAYFPLRDRPPTAVFVSTIAVGIILQNGATALFGAAPRAGPPFLAEGTVVAFGGLALSIQSLAILLTAGVVIGGLWLLLARTHLGRQLRAMADDRMMAAAVGVPVTALIALSFALASALAGVAGLLLANQFFVTPTAGTNLIVKAYIAVTIGGWGRLHGAALGAVLIGLFEVGVAALASQPVAEALLYAALLAILVFRPQGLFGEAVGRRA